MRDPVRMSVRDLHVPDARGQRQRRLRRALRPHRRRGGRRRGGGARAALDGRSAAVAATSAAACSRTRAPADAGEAVRAPPRAGRARPPGGARPGPHELQHAARDDAAAGRRLARRGRVAGVVRRAAPADGPPGVAASAVGRVSLPTTSWCAARPGRCPACGSRSAWSRPATDAGTAVAVFTRSASTRLNLPQADAAIGTAARLAVDALGLTARPRAPGWVPRRPRRPRRRGRRRRPRTPGSTSAPRARSPHTSWRYGSAPADPRAPVGEQPQRAGQLAAGLRQLVREPRRALGVRLRDDERLLGSAFSRALSTLGAIPSSSSWSSLNRFGPSSSAATTSSVQRSPTRASASARGEDGSAPCHPQSVGVSPAAQQTEVRGQTPTVQ